MTKLVKILKQIESAGAGINRIRKHLQEDCICFITAFRNENSRKENKKLNKELLSDIKNLQYGVIKVYGGYSEFGEETGQRVDIQGEESYIVINNNIKRASYEERKQELAKQFKDEMLYLCNKYNQNEILIKNYISENNYECGLMNGTGIISTKLSQDITFQELENYWSKVHNTKFKIKEANLDFSDELRERYKGSYNWLSQMTICNLYKEIESKGFHKYKNER